MTDNNSRKTIGVIGGLGPMASVYLTELITMMVDADMDQDHPRMLMYSIPDTPDRTAFLESAKEEKSTESPLPYMQEAARVLEKAGAGFIVVPCVTAQYFYDDICDSVDIPVVSFNVNVAEAVAQMGIKKVALFATDGTIQKGILEKEFIRNGVDVIKPDADAQAEVMKLIYDEVKTGNITETAGANRAQKKLNELADRMFEIGAERVVLGCTELSLIRREALHMRTASKGRFIDMLEILAAKAVTESGAKLREEYEL